MSVELTPKNDGVFCFGVANKTFFDIVNTSNIREIIGEQGTNDPLDIDSETSKLLASAIADWTPPKNWFSPGREQEGKNMFIEFFESCGGFETC